MFHHIVNTKERVESTEYNRVFVTNFNVLGNVVVK